jgi:hypothetical protein
MIIKPLTINGTKYADYQVEGTRIYIKLRRNLAGANAAETEDFLIHLVRLTDNVKITEASYLNI